MKLGVLDIAPELAAEAFGVLRDCGAVVLGSLEAQPNLRIVVSHPELPADCERDDKKPIPVVRMIVKTADEGRRLQLLNFQLDPWAAPVSRRAR